ncbi:DUF5686 and carboxypeptidase-like regulatory domain-containing protein [Mucilaginibacter sp.]|uniref:DUF5686 and carboxypeptidase-like regulatory domain-containing protein n=1 Tax=Mucilaginibacter sp. TaxID=1882438 RepID=UPI00260D8061|nr:DUF5686 and carboxypeptidase-like regulatory domain-containing protein [Mucilaginibacter sp.]MDB4919398.1 carboxypeptidase-like regulatory protein [Mucilaginibacter sp.]
MKNYKKLHLNKAILLIITICLFSFSFQAVSAQESTVVSGTITDLKTRQTLPAVSVSFTGTTTGTSADNNGHFTLRGSGKITSVQFSFIGYKAVVKEVVPGKEQVINVALSEDSRLLNEVVIKSGKKTKYRNKNNPAVELIRQVIAHKKLNRLESFNYAQYHQYEKMVFFLSDLSDKFKEKRIFKNYQFLFRQQDSTAIGGKNLLPVYMEEKLADNYFRKSPYAKKEIIQANKQVKYDEGFIDNEGLKSYFNKMYQDIDIYDNNIALLGNQMLSPIADAAPSFYMFFISDTIKDVNPHLIELSFTPRNNTDLLFAGKIYITMDGNFAVEKAALTVNKNINLNFVRQMQAVLSFDKGDEGKYHLSQSDLKIDFGLNKKKGGGVYGERVVMVNNFKVNVPAPDSTYTGPAEVVAPGAAQKGEEYWEENRLDTLSGIEDNIYKGIDSLQTIPSFKRTMKIATLLLAGYWNTGPFEIGPTNTFYNFNPVEGFRLRLGGRTTSELSKRYYFETYGAYGFKDEKFKYFLSGTYSLNNKSIYSFPQQYLRASYQHDTKIPGQELQFVQEDNFFLSFKRGENTTWLYNDIFRLNYVHEYLNHFSYKFQFQTWNQHPAGTLYFENAENGVLNNINGLKTTELSAEFRYAPHEKFYQGKLYRTPIPDKYPIFTLRYNQGLSGVLGGKYSYENLTANITKRFYLSQLGYADVSTEGGYLFGKVPFPLLDIHHANQSYALQLQSYNLMNFLEFVSDHYAAINIDQNFNGFIFNKIPLLKKLKWREVISLKALWGGVRSENNPANDPSLYQFPVNSEGVPTTYSLNNKFYTEGSIGIANIFKVLRLDYVKRFSYLDHPNAPKHGIRALVIIQF